MSYKFNVTRRAGDGSDDGASTEFKSTNLLAHAKYWLMWRKEEEVKLLKLDLSKLQKAKFIEDCRLIGMMNIQLLADAVQQTKVDPHEFVMKKIKVTQEQAETLLKFRLIDLSRLNEKTLRDKIKEIEKEIAEVKAKIANPMPVVVHYLREVAKDSDARRTRISNRLQDESKMQQSGDPRAVAVTSEGKLLGVIDDKGSTSATLLVAPTFTGIAVFGKSSTVSFFGPAAVGKSGPGLDSVVGIAQREAKYLIAVSKDGKVLKHEQDQDSMRSIPVFLKASEIIFGGGAWEDDVLIIWDEDEKCKTIKVKDIPTQRKNSGGTKISGINPAKAMIARRGQKLTTLGGQEFSVKDPSSLNHETCVALGQRNMIISGTRRKIVDLKTAVAEIHKGSVTGAFDLTLPESQT
jgi:DNA gyrase/topoisomerase IV subunit A